MNTPTLTIDPKFKKLIDPLTPEEYAQLEANCLDDGILDPIKIWSSGSIILDGHNRYAIAQEHRLDFKTVTIYMPDREAAENWIDENQLGRRNLAPDKMALIRGRIYNRSKKAHGDVSRTSPKGQSDPLGNTASALAPKLGVSEKTLKRDGAFAEAVETLDLAEDVAAGKVDASRAEVIQAAKDLPAKPTPKQKAKAREKLEEPKAPKPAPIKAPPLGQDQSLVPVTSEERARLVQLERLVVEKDEQLAATQELMSGIESDQETIASLIRVVDAGGNLKAMMAENKRLMEDARICRARLAGAMATINENKGWVKFWKDRHDGLIKKVQKTREKFDASGDRDAFISEVIKALEAATKPNPKAKACDEAMTAITSEEAEYVAAFGEEPQ